MSDHYEDIYSDNDHYGVEEDQVKEKETLLLQNATKEEDYQQIIDKLLANISSPQNDIEKNMKDLKKCLDEYFNHHNQKKFGDYFRKSLKQLNEIAIQYLNVEKIDMSLIILNECDLLTQAYNGFADMQILTYNNLSCYFRKCKDQKRALKLLEKAEGVYNKNQGSSNIGITFLNKSAILSEMGRHQEAIKCAKGAVMELKSLFEKVFAKKNERQEKNQNIKNFKSSIMSNSKVDNTKLEEDFYQRESENNQINSEFADIATELGIAYHNLATEEQYFKLFDKSIKNFYNAYVIVKEYLGENHPLTAQFYSSFEAINKKYQQHINSTNIQEANKQKKSPQKINESPEHHQRNNQSSQFNNTQIGQTQNSVEEIGLNDSKEMLPNKNSDFQIQRQNFTSNEQKKERKMLKKQLEGTVMDYKQQMKVINPPVYNLLYSDEDIDQQYNDLINSSIPNTKARMEQYKQQYQQPTQPIKQNVNPPAKKPQIYNYLYFENPKEMQQFNQKQVKQGNQPPVNNIKTQKASELVENASQCSESPRNNERKLRILDIDQLLIRRNKSSSNQGSKGGNQPWGLPKDRHGFEQGASQKEHEKHSEKSEMSNDQNHPGFFLAKKMQGKYSKLSSVRPITAQEILAQPTEKKEVGGRKYKVNPKLLIPDTIIEAANRYQDYLQRENSSNQRKSFVIKSSSAKNFNQIHRDKLKSQDNVLTQQNKDYLNTLEDDKDTHPSKSQTTKNRSQIDFQHYQSTGKFSNQNQSMKASDRKIGQSKLFEKNNNFKQQLEQMKERLTTQNKEQQDRQKQQQKWNFESDKADTNPNHERESMKSNSSSHPRQTDLMSSIKKKMAIPQHKDRKASTTVTTVAASEIPEEYIIVSPYLNSAIKAKSNIFSAIKKGRLCCVFDEISYVLLFSFQDISSGQGVEIEDQSKLYISLAHLRDIFTPIINEKEKNKSSSYKYQSQSESVQSEQELNEYKFELLRENLDTIFKKFKSILLIDIEKKCLTLEQNFSGFTILLKTPLHPKGVVTKINFQGPSQNASASSTHLPFAQNSSENSKNLKNMLIVEYPPEELFLLKENKKLDELTEQFIILQRFVYTSVSNKQGIISVLFNCQTQQLQFKFKSLDQQVDLTHYVVVEPIIQDYGSYFESQDTQIAIGLLCENLMPLWKFDGKNLTYDNNKWSLKNEVEIPKQGRKQFIYQIVQQPSNDFSLIQKKDVWLEVYEDSSEILVAKRDQLDKIDESHESEDESRQEKAPLQHSKKPTHSQFSQKDNSSRITNSFATNQNFQIVNKYEDEEFEEEDTQLQKEEYQKKQSPQQSPFNSRKQSQEDVSRIQNKKQSAKFGEPQQQNYQQPSNLHTQSQGVEQNQYTQYQQNNNSQQQQYVKSEQIERNPSHKNSYTSHKSKQQEKEQYDIQAQKKLFEQLDFERAAHQKNEQEQKSPLQKRISEINENNGGDSSKNNRSRNNSSHMRPQSSKKQMDIKNNLTKGGATPQRVQESESPKNFNNENIIDSSPLLKQDNTPNYQKQNVNQKNKTFNNDQQIHGDISPINKETNQLENYKQQPQQADNQNKRGSIRDRPEAINPRSRTNSLKIPQDQNKKNYSLNVSQEKEGDVEYIDIDDTQKFE